MKKLLFACVLPFFLFACNSGPGGGQESVSAADSAAAERAQFRALLDSISKRHPAQVGLALMHLESGDTLTLNNAYAYRMQSVYKFPQALLVMKMVDEGKLTLDQKLRLGREDIHSRHNIIFEKYPEGGAELPVSELLLYTLSNSDNNSSELLFKSIGGAIAVERYVQGLGIGGLVFHEDSSRGRDYKYIHTTQPFAIVQLLAELQRGKLLSDSSTRFLLKTMEESVSGPQRIKGLLPAGTVVAHKTGTSREDGQGHTPACNDVGLITLPNGEHLALAILINEAAASLEDNEKLIAELAAAIYQHYVR